MSVEVVSDIARLRDCIDRAAAATESTLAGGPGASERDDPVRKELSRQLAALRERVAAATRGNEDPAGLRAELATLLSFAHTLQADAGNWRSALQGRIEERERQRTVARREREREAAERELLARRRDALRLRIVQTAARMAQRDGGEYRRTLPVVTLDEGLTVCSASVSYPRRGLRLAQYWLVTLNASRDDVLIRRE
jgi:hypothetical protein